MPWVLGGRAQHFMAPVGGGERVLQERAVGREVVVREEGAGGGEVLGQRRAEGAAIERPHTRRGDAAEALGKGGLADDLAQAAAAGGAEDSGQRRLAGGEACIDGAIEEIAQYPVHRQPVGGDPGCRAERVGQGDGAEAGQGLGPGVGRPGHRDGERPTGGHALQAAGAVGIDGGGGGRAAAAVDGLGLPPRGIEPQGEAIAADPVHEGNGGRERGRGRHGRVHGVAPVRQHPRPGLRGQMMPGHDHAAPAHDNGPVDENLGGRPHRAAHLRNISWEYGVRSS